MPGEHDSRTFGRLSAKRQVNFTVLGELSESETSHVASVMSTGADTLFSSVSSGSMREMSCEVSSWSIHMASS